MSPLDECSGSGTLPRRAIAREVPGIAPAGGIVAVVLIDGNWYSKIAIRRSGSAVDGVGALHGHSWSGSVSCCLPTRNGAACRDLSPFQVRSTDSKVRVALKGTQRTDLTPPDLHLTTHLRTVTGRRAPGALNFFLTGFEGPWTASCSDTTGRTWYTTSCRWT